VVLVGRVVRAPGGRAVRVVVDHDPVLPDVPGPLVNGDRRPGGAGPADGHVATRPGRHGRAGHAERGQRDRCPSADRRRDACPPPGHHPFLLNPANFRAFRVHATLPRPMLRSLAMASAGSEPTSEDEPASAARPPRISSAGRTYRVMPAGDTCATGTRLIGGPPFPGLDPDPDRDADPLGLLFVEDRGCDPPEPPPPPWVCFVLGVGGGAG